MGKHKQRLIAFLVLAIVLLQPVASVFASVACLFHDQSELVASNHDDDGLGFPAGTNLASPNHAYVADQCERTLVMADITSRLSVGLSLTVGSRVGEIVTGHFIDVISPADNRPPILVS